MEQVLLPLRNHSVTQHPDLLIGLREADDAAVYRIDDGRALVQTVDFFTPVVDDPYDWGRIAAANALSDIYVMGGRPITALQLVAWPRGALSFEILSKVIEGGASVMASAGCTIVGGHSVDGPEPTYGFAVTGLVDPDQIVTTAGALPGDYLVVTKPLGTGIVSTAIKRDLCPAEVAVSAVETMTMLNDIPGLIGCHAATDVTGFGLLGHLWEMLVASDVAAEINIKSVPILGGVLDLLRAGCYPGGSERNLAWIRPHLVGEVDEEMVRLLADAQTNGGLLVACPEVPSFGTLIGRIANGPPAIRLL